MHNSALKCGDFRPKISISMTQKWACGDHCREWIPISTLSHHSLYLKWDIETVQLLWLVSTIPIYAQFLCEMWGPQAQNFPIIDSKVSLWGPLQRMNSNIHLVSPFIILEIRHWNSSAAVTCIRWSKHAQFSCEMWGPQAETFPTHDSKASLWGPL